MRLWTKQQIEERISILSDRTHGASGRLAEVLMADPDCDVSSQLEFIRSLSRGVREARAALDRFDIMDFDPQPIEFVPVHGV